jgi:hypothetical protein
MTTAEFLALSPRERDAVVAERVLGWVWMSHLGIRLYGKHGDDYKREDFAAVLIEPPIKERNERFKWDTTPPKGNRSMFWADFPSLTTCRTDMWLVIDAMRERGWRWEIVNGVDGTWYVRLIDSMGRIPFRYNDDELPLAASIAALRAVGEVTD